MKKYEIEKRTIKLTKEQTKRFLDEYKINENYLTDAGSKHEIALDYLKDKFGEILNVEVINFTNDTDFTYENGCITFNAIYGFGDNKFCLSVDGSSGFTTKDVNEIIEVFKKEILNLDDRYGKVYFNIQVEIEPYSK